MASPVGHAIAGFALGRLGERAAAPSGPSGPALWIGAAVLAVAPDFDFLPGVVLGQPARFHQGPSHSLLGAVVVSGVAALLLFRGRATVLRAWPIFFVAYASHMAMDFFGPDGRAPIGMPLFWPLSDATFLSPVTLLPGIHHAATAQTPTGEWLGSVFSVTNLLAVGIEVAVTAPLVLLAELQHGGGVRRSSAGGPR